MFGYSKCWDRQHAVRCLFVAVSVVCLTACADVVQQPVDVPIMRSEATIPQVVAIDGDQKVDVSTGYSRTVRSGTHWRYIGSLSQGEVYKPTDSTFTVESKNIHEAYLVIKNKMLIGYYLPVEQTISLLDHPVQ
ncbi:MAG TPA: hypothetical protein VFW00_04205, partial [Rhodocyclaceae bacterium]|nr:hypothetical protein [Rhodocyclaceae bacterium]